MTVLEDFYRGMQIGENIQAAPQRRALQNLGVQERQEALRSRASQRELTESNAMQAQALNRVKYVNQAAKALRSIPLESRAQSLQQFAPIMQELGIDQSQITAENLQDAPLDEIISSTDAFISSPGNITAAQRDFANLTKDLSEEDLIKARRIKLGLDPRAMGSAAQTILNLGTAEGVAGVEKTLAGGKEAGKLEQQFKYKPMIESAVATAKRNAESRGEALSDLAQAKAAMPGLLETIAGLKQLAPLATYTMGGKAWDAVVKELGFGATEGSTARAKFISMISNQVLPLLKPTFGGSFTVAEGDSLRATMGDPDEPPENKIAVLESFIENKFRELETKERSARQSEPESSGVKFLGFE